MNILIFPTGDRSGLASIIYHYQKLGHSVFIPKPKTLGLQWNKNATWPSRLFKSSFDKSKRNLYYFPVDEKEVLFGEDSFLIDFESSSLYKEEVSCSIIDLKNEFQDIHVFHTLRGADEDLPLYFKIAKEYFPKAKWVSSTVSAWKVDPGNYRPSNVAKFIPANYENSYSNVNNINIFCLPFEKELLDIDCETNKIPTGISFASFNHNFHIRQATDFALFSKMNSILQIRNLPEVPNFGGNVRGSGADVRYSGDNGCLGKFQTLSPRQCYKFTSNLKSAVHFKQTDWGGGVFYYCLNSGVPILTTKRYVHESNSSRYLVNDYNAIIVENEIEAANAIEKLNFDDEYVKKLKLGMLDLQSKIFQDSYWENWDNFLQNLS